MPWTRHTLASLRRDLQHRVEVVPYWSQEEARLALNEGLLFWNLLTGTWKARVTVDAVTASSPLIALPSTLVFGTRIAYQQQPLAVSSVADLLRGRPTAWRETTASGGDVPTRPMIWAPVSLSSVLIWPAPAAIVVNAYTIDGVAQTPVLLYEESAVDLEDGVWEALLDYALHTLAFKEGARFGSTSSLLQGFLALAAEHNEQLTKSAAFRTYMGLARKDLVPTRGGQSRLAMLGTGGEG
jgi:hypothetical protein